MFTAAAQTDSFSEGQVKSIEKIVKDYLLNHPEILSEAQEALERKAESARTEATHSHLPVFYKTLASMKSELAGMTAGSGDVTVVEFFDYNCGYCRRTLPDLVKLIENEPNINCTFMFGTFSISLTRSGRVLRQYPQL